MNTTRAPWAGGRRPQSLTDFPGLTGLTGPRLVVALAAWAVAWSLVACGGDAAPATADGVTLGDVATLGDAGADGQTDALGDASADIGPQADLPGDTGDGQGDAVEACTPPPTLAGDPADPAGTKYALSMFHFNLEYVIGGLTYLDDAGKEVPILGYDEALGWDDQRVEDWIITDTFQPILDVYEAHPGWRVTLEFQGRFVEALAQRHPAVLEQLRRMAQAGQAELVSFHYDDQLFLAFPREDLQRSMDHTKEVFARLCLPLSGVVFNQEGQAGEGRQQMLVDNGYAIGVYPKNLWRYVHDGEAYWPYYESRGGTLVVGPGGVDPAAGVDVNWTFFDDGELRAVTKGVNPYMAPLFQTDPDRVAEYEAKLQGLADQGYKITSITDYVRQLELRGVEKKAAPPLVDGTWQPPSTDSIHRWLGGRSQAFVGADEDNRVRAGNAVARMHVAALQVLTDFAASEGVLGDADVAQADAALAWEGLWRAEVSDCSGVNPWRGEVLFGVRTNEWLMNYTAQQEATLLAALGKPHARVDLATREVTLLDSLPAVGNSPPPVASGPLTPAVHGDGRQVTPRWFQVGPSTWRYVVEFSPAAQDETCTDCDYRLVSVSFPRTEDALLYTPGLAEGEVLDQPFDAFHFLDGHVYLPLANGLIGVGGDLWVVKHVRQVHIAARVGPAHPDVDFIDATIPSDEGVTWTFEVFQGSQDDALALANRLNLTPVVEL